jgi:hypothetical protein
MKERVMKLINLVIFPLILATVGQVAYAKHGNCRDIRFYATCDKMGVYIPVNRYRCNASYPLDGTSLTTENCEYQVCSGEPEDYCNEECMAYNSGARSCAEGPNMTISWIDPNNQKILRKVMFPIEGVRTYAIKPEWLLKSDELCTGGVPKTLRFQRKGGLPANKLSTFVKLTTAHGPTPQGVWLFKQPKQQYGGSSALSALLASLTPAVVSKDSTSVSFDMSDNDGKGSTVDVVVSATKNDACPYDLTIQFGDKSYETTSGAGE